MYDILNRLMDTPSGSGAEEKIALFLQKEIGKYFDETYFDNAKNLVFHKKGKGENIMFCTSLDTDSVVATSVEDGSANVYITGNISAQTCSQRLITFEGGAKGLLICKADANKGASETFVELLSNQPDIAVGEKGFFDADFASLGDDIYAGFGLCAKLCILSMILSAKNIANTDKNVYFVFTVQSKLGFRSSMQAANTVKPDKAYVIGASEGQFGKILIRVLDKSFTASKVLVDKVQEVAKKCSVEYCLVAKPEQISQCSKIASANDSCLVCQIDLPAKYCDTVRECARLCDAENMANIIEQLILAD